MKIKNVDWPFFQKGNLSLERQERVIGATEGDCDHTAVRRSLIKLFLDSIYSQERKPPPGSEFPQA